MTELEIEKQIAELRKKAAQEIHPIHFDPTDFKSYDAAFDGGFDDGKIIMARKALKIIESLQAENQELKIHAAGVYLNDQIKIGNLEAENQRLRERLEWKPIESAPMDGTEILVFKFNTYYGSICHVALWDKEENYWFVARQGDGYEEQIITINPTHWMPLPKAPSQLNTKETKGESNESN